MTPAIAPLLLMLSPTACPTDQPVRVTVVIVLATKANKKVDPALVELAKAVQQHDTDLTGFRVYATEEKSIAVGDSATFALIDKQELKVTVTRSKGADGRVALALKAPEVEKVTYACVCGKFFPIATPYRTKKGEVLIVAVMGKPCTLGKKARSWLPWPD
jgi:hypothetical protein